MTRHFFLRRNLARFLLRIVRWKPVGTPPQAGILVGYPHTSNWDWVLSVLMAWTHNVQLQILVKESFFKGPLAPIMRASGAIELDRDNPGATIRKLVERAKSDDNFLLAIAAEGTRGKVEFWKSGFYRISQQTGLPITLSFLDAPSRQVGFGVTFQPTGDVAADMDRIREFYADKQGIYPENTSPPRLREEGETLS